MSKLPEDERRRGVISVSTGNHGQSVAYAARLFGSTAHIVVPEGANAAFAEMTWRERLVMAPLVLLIVLLGVFPGPVLDRVSPSVDRLIQHVEDHSDYQQPAVAAGSHK